MWKSPRRIRSRAVDPSGKALSFGHLFFGPAKKSDSGAQRTKRFAESLQSNLTPPHSTTDTECTYMEMIRVRSSAISFVGYDPASRRMRIAFVQGHTYDFCGVPEHVFSGLLSARSKGNYYNAHIRDRYQC